jgi:DNA-binding transcriptional LysR family regulator
VRTNRGLVPTEAGTCAVRFARLIQSDIGHLQQELSVIASGAGGGIAVGTIMGAVPLLTRALTRLMDRQPESSVAHGLRHGGFSLDDLEHRRVGRQAVPDRCKSDAAADGAALERPQETGRIRIDRQRVARVGPGHCRQQQGNVPHRAAHGSDNRQRGSSSAQSLGFSAERGQRLMLAFDVNGGIDVPAIRRSAFPSAIRLAASGPRN